MKSFSSGGITRRTACGSTTNRIACDRSSPSDRAAAVWLGCTDSMPAVHLGHVRGVDERQRDDGPEDVAVRHALELQRRHPEPQDEDDEDRRHAAEQDRIGHGEDPERREDRPGQAAHAPPAPARTISTSTSAVRKIFTLSQKPSRIFGKESMKISSLKKASFTPPGADHPGELHDEDDDDREEHDRAQRPRSRRCVRLHGCPGCETGDCLRAGRGRVRSRERLSLRTTRAIPVPRWSVATRRPGRRRRW